MQLLPQNWGVDEANIFNISYLVDPRHLVRRKRRACSAEKWRDSSLIRKLKSNEIIGQMQTARQAADRGIAGRSGMCAEKGIRDYVVI